MATLKQRPQTEHEPMSKAGDKLIGAMHEALEVAKCGHQYIEGAVILDGKRVLRCMLCGAVVHIIGEKRANVSFGTGETR